MTKVFANSQVAHVWASGSQAYGRSNNGNFYFDGRILYSYGSHFAVGVRMGDSAAVLNSDSYSVSTSGHQSDARNAVSHMTTVVIPKLTDIARDLSYLANNPGAKGPTDAILNHIAAHAVVMEMEVTRYDSTADCPRARRDEYGEPMWRGAHVSTGQTRAEVLADMCGIPAVRARAAVKRGKIAADKKAKAQSKAAAASAKLEAMKIADMNAGEFDSFVERRWHVKPLTGERSDEYSIDRMREASKAVFRLQKVAKANGMSVRRIDSLKIKRAALQSVIRAFDADQAGLAEQLRAERFANWLARYNAAKDDDARLAVWRSNAVSANAYPEGSSERAALESAYAEGQRLNSEAKMREQAEARADWLAGRGSRQVRLDGPNGAALVRRSLDGERLETSHGADVPWEHAVKAFRFIRLCVEKGEGWARNGRVIRVGHYQIDRIEPNGDMVAGCHRFAWADMRALAEREGVLSLAPSSEAVESREVAA